MDKIKVLEIGLSYKVGGIETFLLNICSNLNLEHIEISFINTFESAKNENFYQELKNIGKIYDIPDYRKHPIKFWKKIAEINKREQFDIFHYNMNSACYLLPLIVAKICGIKTIIAHSHNSANDKGLLKTIIHNLNKKIIPFFANTFFACSNVAGKWFFTKKIMNSDNYYVINNAVDINKYKYNYDVRKKMRYDLDISDSTIVLGNVGRFKTQKNHEFLVKVFYEYHLKNLNSLLLLVGTGPLLPKIQDMVNECGLSDSVLFLGERKDVEKLYQAMDIFVLPSFYEGLPLVGVEAQISGLTCLFSDAITSELSLSGNAHFHSLDNGPAFWSEYILNLKVNDRKTVYDDRFDIEKNSHRLEEIFCLLKNKNR